MAIEVKICGLTNLDDARCALECGADYLGFVLFAGSPRGLDAAALRRIAEALPPDARKIAVFVNQPPAFVATVADDCGLYAVQIHGDETAAGFSDLRWPVWRAVALRDGGIRPSPDAWPAARYVVDAAAPGRYGGTGIAADWAAAARLAAGYPVMLAGGLTPDNVDEGVRFVRPLGVDVASGVEASKGRKDPAKVKAFIAAARRAMM